MRVNLPAGLGAGRLKVVTKRLRSVSSQKKSARAGRTCARCGRWRGACAGCICCVERRIVCIPEFFDSIANPGCGILEVLKTSGTENHPAADDRYATGKLVRRLLALAWRFRADCVWSVVLSLVLLLLGILGLKLLGLVIDIIRQALDPSLPPPAYPFGWHPPAAWSALQIVTALALTIVAQAVFRAVLTYAYNMITARLTQGEIVPALRAQLYAKLQRLSFSFFDVHGSNSIFNRVTGDVQNTRLFVDGVLLQGVNMILTLAAYAFFMWRIQPALTLACLSVSVPLWWLAHFYSARLRPGYLRNRELTDHMILLFSESVRGMQTVKGFAAEAHQVRRFEAANDEVSSQQRKIFWDLSIFTPGTQMLSQLSLVILFAYGGWLYRAGENSAWQRAGGFRRLAPAVHRAGREHFHNREFSRSKVWPPRAACLKCWTRRWRCKAGPTPSSPAGSPDKLFLKKLRSVTRRKIRC